MAQTLWNLNGACADSTDDVTHKVLSEIVFGKPAKHWQMSEEKTLQSLTGAPASFTYTLK